jgi:hypothetical protein
VIAIAMTVLRFAWPFLLLGGVYLWADRGWCNHACHSAQNEAAVQKQAAFTFREQLAELDRQRIQQQERHLQLTAAEELRQRKQDADRTKRFQPIRKQAAGEYRGIAITDTARKLLGDAYAAAQDAEAPREPDKAAPADPGSSTVGDLIVWSVDMLEWASVCKARVDGWQQWYESLTKDQP